MGPEAAEDRAGEAVGEVEPERDAVELMDGDAPAGSEHVGVLVWLLVQST